ncbi:MAG: DUF84 family protein [Anaerolineae bacterium]|nr:DUF84 family protein [Anaerolineae bacterium]
MLIAVGSNNPIKLAATQAVFSRIYGPEIQIISAIVPSGVSDQPWGDKETLQGALNRARASQVAYNATLGVGLEGGLLEIDGQLFTSAWCAVVRADGLEGIGGGANMLLPPSIVMTMQKGGELGPAIDALTGEHNTKHNGGAIGALTQGWLNRQHAYEHILTLALARMLSPHYYGDTIDVPLPGNSPLKE